MARIRSIHPGIWTDEAFMSASPYARLLIMGIWGEAFDDGVFEWKPLTLKARLFPVDSIDMPALLAEIEALDFIRRVEIGGKAYGLVRNFRRYQRPKKPNSSGVNVDEFRIYLGFEDRSSDPVENQYGTDGEKSPQMEDGGGKRDTEEPVGSSDAPSVASPSADLTPLQRVWHDYPHQIAAMAGKPEGPIRKWMGKALKAASPEAFAAAADAALRAGTRDPCAYVTAALKNTGPPQARSRDGYAEILDMLEATDEPDHSHPAEPHRDDLHRPAPFDRDARRPLVERVGAGSGRVVDLAPLRAEPRRA